jgi:hypothetical protein
MASEVGAAERAERTAVAAEERAERSAAGGVDEEFPDVPTAPQSPYGSGLTKRPLQPRNGETVSGEFEIKDMPNPAVDEAPQAYVRFQHKTFDTLDDAMVDAERNFNPDSIAHGHELSGLPFRTPEGRYGYSGPVVELNNSANISDPAKAIIHPEWGTRVPADWHTHGNYDSAVARYAGQGPTLVPSKTPGEFLWSFPNGDRFAPNTFSGMDVTGAMMQANDFGMHYTRYLGTPSGSIRWMTAQPNGGRLVEGIMFPPGTAW